MTMMDQRWKNRVALVTGASSGIGTATARELSELGMRVAICARRVERLHEIEAELGEERCLCLEGDLRSEAQILDAFDTIRAVWGGVDVLVNNAGLGYEGSLFEGEESERWREMLEVNVLALSICTREAVRSMRARGDEGHVIHVGSMAGHRIPGVRGSMYAATKQAVRALTEGLRRELRELDSEIRVSAVSPGLVETEFHGVYLGDAEAAREVYSRFQVLRAEDIAEAVRYLLTAPPHVQVHDILIRPTRQRV